MDSTIEAVKNSGVDAVILGNAACGACSTACGVAAGRLEASGIPTVTVTREDFVDVVRNAASGLGLPADLSMVTFPIDLFIPDADLTPLSARRQEIYDGLTSWTPELRNDTESATLSVEGRDYEDILFKANNLFILNRWGDGLPLWPASQQRVDWILRGTDLPRDHLLGRFPPRGAYATVEACAIALAMTGGRPEYLSVLIASVEALLDPKARIDQMQATSGATFPVIIVNGPIAKQIRLNSGFGCLGPDPQHPAGASIGRALRQMQQNLGGAQPGARHHGALGRDAHHQRGFCGRRGRASGRLAAPRHRAAWVCARHELAVLLLGHGCHQYSRRGAMKETLEQDVLEGLHRMAGYLAVPNIHYLYGYDTGTPGAMLLTKVVAKYWPPPGGPRRRSASSSGRTRKFRRKHCVASAARPGSRLPRPMWRAKHRTRPLADRRQARKHHPGGGRRRSPDPRVLDAGLLARCHRT